MRSQFCVQPVLAGQRNADRTGLVGKSFYQRLKRGIVFLVVKLFHHETHREFRGWQNRFRLAVFLLAVMHTHYLAVENLMLHFRMPLLFFLLFIGFIHQAEAQQKNFTSVQGAVVRGDSQQKEISLVFTADEFGDGLAAIRKTLKKENVKGSFFFTGRFYRNPSFQKEIKKLQRDSHYLGPHSDQHLLYCDWNKRDSLFVTRDSFAHDITQNLDAMAASRLPIHTPHFFIPPYEWWNDTIASWSKAQGLLLFNFTPGIRTNADYTFPEMGASYKSTEWILNWLRETLASDPKKFNGAIVLIHAGTDPRRKDRLYEQLSAIISLFRMQDFRLRRIDELLSANSHQDGSREP